MAHPGGRPLKFKSVEDLEDRVMSYFAECDPHWIDETTWDYPRVNGKKNYDSEMVEVTRKVKTPQIPYTITGLALALDTTRDVLIDYEDKEEYSYTIKKAKQMCHNFAERRLFESNAAGPIFNLKNNYGWKDQTIQDLHVKEMPKPIIALSNTTDDIIKLN